MTNDIQIDYFRNDGNTGGTLVGNELSVDATTITRPENDPVNWALQLKTCPDAKKPGVRFRGKAKKKPGSRPTRVKGVASDEGAVKMIVFRASTGDKKTLSVNRAKAPFVFKFRNRKMKPRVRVKIIAIDLRGNRKVGKRVYR